MFPECRFIHRQDRVNELCTKGISESPKSGTGNYYRVQCVSTWANRCTRQSLEPSDTNNGVNNWVKLIQRSTRLTSCTDQNTTFAKLRNEIFSNRSRTTAHKSSCTAYTDMNDSSNSCMFVRNCRTICSLAQKGIKEGGALHIVLLGLPFFYDTVVRKLKQTRNVEKIKRKGPATVHFFSHFRKLAIIKDKH